jgi:hypothetical protein
MTMTRTIEVHIVCNHAVISLSLHVCFFHNKLYVLLLDMNQLDDVSEHHYHYHSISYHYWFSLISLEASKITVIAENYSIYYH